ncbi:uncharacterized protein LOC143581128 [Bidens hawaiensis]|uniref:uncharacterized protein LOC143581128 n=1 Tax=Bidens hawaiensis TaxID=980011 RepID=UPI00404951E8
MSTTTAAVKPVRKFPPPCWTRDEALVLIEAYRERWYALHRAFLKNPDWDAVAEKVTTACPDVTPPKTSAQCRHKMEKLRQRHRAEKLRAASFPADAFFSSWFYFEAMENMENNNNNNNNNNNSNNNQVTPNSQNSLEISNGIPVSVSDHQVLNPGRGIRFKPAPPVQNLVTLAASNPNFSFDPRVSNPSYANNWANQDDDENEDDGYLINSTNLINSTGNYNSHKAYGMRPPRKFSKVVNDHQVDEKGEMWVKVPRNVNAKGKKKGDDGVREVVASIKLLGDGFMKMEKMKIDMCREIERMRMEAEMRRNELILESQKQIVDAFVKGLVESRKQQRAGTMADS